MSSHPLLEFQTPTERQSESRRWGIGFHRYALFGYFSPYMRLAKEQGSGAVRPDLLPDLWLSDDLVEWSSRFTSSASKTQQTRGSSKWALVYALYGTFWPQFYGILFIKLITTLLSLLSIILMSRFLHWQEQAPETVTAAERNKGLVAGAGILTLELLNIIGGAQCNFWAQRVGLRVQGVLAAGLFKRAIRAPDWSRCTESDTAPKASAYNLLMIDVPSIAEFVFALTDIIVLPIRVALSFELLRHQVGASAMAGLLCLIAVVTIIMGLEVQSGFLKAPYLHYRDVRISRCHDALSDIRVLRMIGWEDVSSSSIKDARQKEISYRQRRMYLDSIAASLSNAACKIVNYLYQASNILITVLLDALTQIAIFVAYVVWGLSSDASFVFKASVAIPVMQVVGRLVGPLTNLPFITNSLIEGYISMERYEQYIFGAANLTRELESDTISTDDTASDSALLTSYVSDDSSRGDVEYPIDPNENLILVKDAIFTWVPFPKFYDGETPIEERFSTDYLALGESGSTIMSPTSVGLPPRPPYPPQSQPHLFGDPTSFIPRSSTGDSIFPDYYKSNFRLHVRSLEVKAGECIAIIGPPGSGKSSLLLALLGEVPQVQGCSKIVKSRGAVVAYASQVPWIPGGTVRSSILFGRAYNQVRYEKVIDACELQQDFNSWPEGDNRVVSEGASNLSGGQRARVALARAVYDFPETLGHGTNVFLLDDPFSSIDPRVALNIFKNLFGLAGLIKHAAVILTIDEASLRFFIESLNASGSNLSVNLRTQLMEKGSLLDSEGRISATAVLTTVHPTSINTDRLPWESEFVPPPPEQAPTFVEQAYSGVVGKQTYKWYCRHVGYIVLLAMAVMIMTLHLTGTAADFWIAHWTALAPEERGKESAHQVSHSAPDLKTTAALDKPSLTLSQSHLIHRDSALHGHPSFFEMEKKRIKKGLQWSLEPDTESYSFMEATYPTFSHIVSTAPTATENDEVNLSALAIFVMLSLASAAAIIVLYLFGTFGVIRAAVSLHMKLLNCVINAPFWLYDFLPIGVIINRFSADTEVVDGGPLFSMSYFFGACVHVCITVIALCALSPWCSPLIPFVAWAVYAFVYTLYRPTCREFQRSKLLALSPLCGNLSEAESGAVVIRALGAQRFYAQQNIHLTKNLMKAQFMQIGSNNWATTRLQLLAFPFTILNSVVPVLLRLLGLSAGVGLLNQFLHEPKGSQMAGFVGLAISFALALPTAIGGVVWSVSLLEQKMCSVQRLGEIVSGINGTVDSEGRIVLPESEEVIFRSVQSLPHRSGLQLKDVDVSYQRLKDFSVVSDTLVEDKSEGFARENLPPSLINISVEAKAGECIGVIGRTGSGKSTLLLSLLNLVPHSKGTISIDGVPLNSFSKGVLRQIIGVLPQSPIVLRGWTIRRFLDPHSEFPHEDVLKILQAVGLAKAIAGLSCGLDTVIAKDRFGERERTEQKHIGVTAAASTATRELSDIQLRLLSLARLALHANQYRLVLVDEPPPRQLTKSAKTSVEVSLEKRRIMAGEQGATYDVNESEAGSTIEEVDDEIEVADLLKSVFPLATVVIAAHHASTLQKCDSIWVLSKGRLVAKCNAATVKNQESLMEIILAHEGTENTV